MRHDSITDPCLALLASAATLIAGATAAGSVTHAEWSSPTDFHFHVNYMPDLDQERLGLPGQGSMFCVPTATMNLFAYIADWGFEDLPPGPGVWQGEVGYIEMTNQLEALGELMDTGTTGTNYRKWRSGTGEWLEGHALSRAMFYKADNWCPTLSHAAMYARSGALVAVVYGRYRFNPGPIPVIRERTSGHCVTVAHMRADGTLEELSTRDPGDGGHILSERPWAMRVYDSVETRPVRQDWDDDALFEEVDVTVLEYNPDSDRIRFIDKVYIIQPTNGWSWSAAELNVVSFAGDFQWARPVIPAFEPLPDYGFATVENHPDIHSYLTLQTAGDEDAELVALDRFSGDATRIAPFPGATDFVVGRHRELYVLAGHTVHRVDLEGNIIYSALAASPSDAITYRDETDEVIVVSTSQRTMTVFPRSLGRDHEQVFEYDLPAAIPVSSKPSIAVREGDGAVAILVPETEMLVHAVRPVVPGGTLKYLTERMPEPARSVAIDDNDHLVVATEASTVLEFQPDPECWWCWDPVARSLYRDLAPHGVFNMTRSRTNYDPAINRNDDEDIPAEELPEIGRLVYDCPGDLDFDGVVAFGDLLAVLAAWGPCAECPEDLDLNDEVDFGDLLIVLGAWGPCVIE